MTAGQIAEVWDWAAHPTAGGMVPIQARTLTRLLQEREALLQAAKYFIENYLEWQATRYVGALKQAVEKAEHE